MPQSCSQYSDLGIWDYDFKIEFSSDSKGNQNGQNYIRVPLSTFAVDTEVDNVSVCIIYVEQLPELSIEPDYPDLSESVIFGSMFFQSFYARFNATYWDMNFYYNITLFVNKNAVSGTYIGDAVYELGENPFQTTTYTLVPMAEDDGLPTFSATAQGIDSTQHPKPYFYLDFSTIDTVLWGVDCTHSAM
jgi:hypothetical protein